MCDFVSVMYIMKTETRNLNGSMYKKEISGKNIQTAYMAPTEAAKHIFDVLILVFEKIPVSFRMTILIMKFRRNRESMYTTVFIGSPLYNHYMRNIMRKM